MFAVKVEEEIIIIIYCDLLYLLIFTICGERQFVISLPVFLFLPHLAPHLRQWLLYSYSVNFGATAMSVPAICKKRPGNLYKLFQNCNLKVFI